MLRSAWDYSLVVCYFVFWYVFCKEGFVHAVWYLDLDSFLDVSTIISAWHFNMVAASHCSCFSQCVGRGQGSAAGAAEDHMICMLDALKCMGLMVRFWEGVHHLLFAILYFRMFF